MTRLDRERRTLSAMMALYCRDRHAFPGGLCRDCRSLLEYSLKRLALCPFKEDKPACAKCAVHCYEPGMRKRVREVMRWVGPRMPWRHPLLALWHWLDQRRPA